MRLIGRMGIEGVLLGLGVVIGKPVGWAIIAVCSLILIAEGIRAWRSRGCPPAATADCWRRLKVQLSKVDSPRTWLALQDDPDRKLPLDDDPVFQWAKDTYGLIYDEFPEAADEFMGGGLVPLGSPFFATAYIGFLHAYGRGDYLENRIALLRGMLSSRANLRSPVRTPQPDR